MMIFREDVERNSVWLLLIFVKFKERIVEENFLNYCRDVCLRLYIDFFKRSIVFRGRLGFFFLV